MPHECNLNIFVIEHRYDVCVCVCGILIISRLLLLDLKVRRFSLSFIKTSIVTVENETYARDCDKKS